jgi:hypothetical protein
MLQETNKKLLAQVDMNIKTKTNLAFESSARSIIN